MAAVNPPDGGGIDDVFPPWRKSSIQACPVTFLAAGEGGGATMAKQEVAPCWLSSDEDERRSPQHANPKRTDDASTLAKDLLGVSLVPEITVQFVPDATSSPSVDQEVTSVFHPVPFRFSFDPPSDPASVDAFLKAYPDLLGYHMWST
jgi:hypothetical protein